MIALKVYGPARLRALPSWSSRLDDCQWRFLAGGDSWFSLGTLNPLEASNILREMRLSSPACVVNCATPGAGWNAMMDPARNPAFHRLLAGQHARPWSGLMISVGGNDLLFRLKAKPHMAHRLLRTEAEWSARSQGMSRYVLPSGLDGLEVELRRRCLDLIALRDSGPSKECPIFLHTYSAMTPRHAPILPGTRPWLSPSMQDYGIPRHDWSELATYLLDTMGRMLHRFAADQITFKGLNVVDTLQVPVVKAAPSSKGPCGDWVNETHMRRSGYRKLGRAWTANIEARLQAASRTHSPNTAQGTAELLAA